MSLQAITKNINHRRPVIILVLLVSIAGLFFFSRQTGRAVVLLLDRIGVTVNILFSVALLAFFVRRREPAFSRPAPAVTDKKTLEEQVHYLAAMIEHSTEAIISRGNDGRLKSWNAGAEKLFGFSKQEAIGKTAVELGFTGLTRQEIGEVKMLVAQCNTWKTEMTYYRKDGSTFFGAVTANGIRDAQGRLSGIVFIIRDISKRKQLEDELLSLNEELEQKVTARTEEIYKREKRFRVLIENITDAIVVNDAGLNILYQSPSVKRILGYEPEERIGKKVLNYVHPGSRRDFIDLYKRLNSTPNIPIAFQYRFLHKDGHYIWLEGKVTNLLGDPGVKAFVANYRDITGRKLSERKLLDSEQHYRMLVDQSVDGIFLSNAEGHYIDVNIAGCGMLGYTRKEMLQKTIADVICGYEMPRINEEVARFDGGAIVTSEWHFLRKDGTIFVGEVIGRRLPGGRLQGILRDITEKKKAEDQLKMNFIEMETLAQRMASILNTLPANIALLDAGGRIVEVNNAWRKFADDNDYRGGNYGIGEDYVKIAGEAGGEDGEDGKAVAEGIINVLDNNAAEFVYEYPCHSPLVKRWFRMVVTPIRPNGCVGAVVMHIDISELRRLEAERLEEKMKEQNKIAHAILQARERERNAIGEELHDNVNQILVATKLFLSIAKTNTVKSAEFIDFSMNNIQDAIDQNRKIAHELVTPDFGTIQLTELLTTLMDNMLTRAGIHVCIDKNVSQVNMLDKEKQLAIYRIAQEQCTNIAKYAKAKSVKVSLCRTAGLIKMVIEDDGLGMETGKKPAGIGMRNIKGRLTVLNGSVKIITAPGQGFALEISMPAD